MSNLNFKHILLQIKETIDQRHVAKILLLEGYKVNRSFKFALREEKTPSTSIRKDGYIKDFGGDFSGNIVTLLQTQRGMSFKNAILYIADQLGIDTNFEYRSTYNPPLIRKLPQPKKAVLSQKRHKEITAEVKFFDKSEELQTFRNTDYQSEVLAIAPLWIWQQTDKENITIFKKFTTYDSKNRTLVIKIHDYSGNLISFKRRRYKKGKWITIHSTHPNSQCLASIPDNHKMSKVYPLPPIYVVEGHHDYLTAILLGINVLMIPTVGYRSYTEYELSLFRNREVYLIPDLKIGCTRGIRCMENLENQIKSIAKHSKVIIIKDMLDLMDISFNADTLDFSDVVEVWDKNLNDFTNTLKYIGELYV